MENFKDYLKEMPIIVLTIQVVVYQIRNFNNKSKKDSLVPESSASQLIHISEEKVRKTPKKVVKKESTNVDFFKKALDKTKKRNSCKKRI